MDMRRLMEQAQQMQKKLKKIEQELDETIYEGRTGGGNTSIINFLKKVDKKY